MILQWSKNLIKLKSRSLNCEDIQGIEINFNRITSKLILFKFLFLRRIQVILKFSFLMRRRGVNNENLKNKSCKKC